MKRTSLYLLAPLVLAFPQVAFAQAASVSGGASAGPNGAGVSTAAGAAPASATAPLTAEEAQAQWADREQKLGETTTLDGSVGLLHTQHAQGGAPGQFRLQFMTEYFSAGFLCTPEFPCVNPRTGGALNEHSLDHIGGQLSLGFGILKWLEGHATTTAYANSSDANRPALIQVLGDSSIGLKAFGKLGSFFHVGGGVDLWLVNGTGAVGLDGSGTSAKFHGIATADLRGLEKKLPLRFSTNLTYSLDSTGAVVEVDEARRNAPVTRIERFGLRVNRVDHFDIKLGGEAFFLEERVRPFAELGIDIPINRQNYECKLNNPSRDKCLANDALAPSRFTIGARILPWKRGVSFTAAFDIGMEGTKTFLEEVSPTPPWMMYLGAGWAIDTKEKPPVETVKTIEKVVQVNKPKGKIAGFVHEAAGPDGKGATAGIPGAIVSWANHPELTALATGSDGRFNTQELDPGDYAFAIKAEGYKPGECTTKIEAAASTVQLDCSVEALPRLGVVVGHAKDEKGDPVANATVKLKAGNGKELQLSTDGQGQFRFADVSPGTASLALEADAFLAAVASVDVKARQDNTVEVTMHHRPKNALVSVDKNEIRIKQQIQFEVNQAVILPASSALLEEIADVFIKTPRIRRVEVQGHTDNTGGTERNRVLSDDRANAVRNWLVSHGVSPDRLVAKGFGESKPLVPNVTAGNKARNRRVQFVILEQDAASGSDPSGIPQKDAPAKKKTPKSDIKLPK